MSDASCAGVEGLNALDAFVEQRTGISLKVLSPEVNDQRLREAMRRAGVSTLHALLAQLRADPERFEAFLSDITVPETYFFRDAAQFVFVRETVFGRFVRTEQRLQVWSAGCATGEEAYSLAILLFELGLSRRARVIGTDISPRAIERAREAEYNAWSLRGVSEQVIEAHFVRRATNFRLDPRITQLVSFHTHNLTTDLPVGLSPGLDGFDLITCKNVFIYLSRKKVQEVAAKLASRLAWDGWLVTGPSDPLLELGDDFETFATSFGLCYQRRQPVAEAHPTRSASFSSTPESIRLSPRSQAPGSASFASRPLSTLRGATALPRDDNDPVAQVRALANQQGSGPAERLCTELLAQAPMSVGLHYVHAVLLLDLRRELEAEASLRRALYLDATLPIAHYLRGILAGRRKDIQASMRAFLCCQAYCERLPQDAPAQLEDGMTNGGLAEAARTEVRRLTAEARGEAP